MKSHATSDQSDSAEEDLQTAHAVQKKNSEMNSKKGGLSMARKNESGISYFPMNTDHHQNSKI